MDWIMETRWLYILLLEIWMELVELFVQVIDEVTQ